MADINVNVQVAHTGYQTFQPPVIVGPAFGTLVQSVSADGPSDAGAMSLSVNAPVNTGNLLLVACRMQYQQVNTWISDTRGNTFYQLQNQVVYDSTGAVHSTFAVWAANPVLGGMTTITVTHPAIGVQSMVILEYACGGQQVSMDVLQWKTQTPSTTTMNSGATPQRSDAAEFLVALVSNAGLRDMTVGTNVAWTLRQNISNRIFAMDVLMATNVPGTDAATGTWVGGVASYGVLVLSFRQGAGGRSYGFTIYPTQHVKPTHAVPNVQLSQSISGGTQIAVTPNDNLQALVDAHLTDLTPVTFNLAPGVYPGLQLKQRDRAASGLITIRSTGAIPADGHRINSTYASQCAQLDGSGTSSTNYSALYGPSGGTGTHNWQFIGIQFLWNSHLTSGTICILGSDTQTNPLLQPNNVTFDRILITVPEDQSCVRGISLNTSAVTVKNSYLYGMKHSTQDSQTLCGWNGPGPFTIDNNYLAAGGEVIMFGGSDTLGGSENYPSNATITHNYITKNYAWRGVWSVIKNCVEFKTMFGALIRGNVIENDWYDSGSQGQYGRLIALSPRDQYGRSLLTQIKDVVIEYNVLRNGGSAVFVMGSDDNYPSAITTNITIRHNLAYGLNQTDSGGNQARFLMVWAGGPDGVNGVYCYNNTHQTMIPQSLQESVLLGAHLTTAQSLHTDLQVHDNVLALGTYSVLGLVNDGGVTGAAGWNQSVTGNSYFNNNVCQRKGGAVNYALPGTGNLKTAEDEVAVDPLTYRVLPFWTDAVTGIPGVGCDIDALDANVKDWP